jgi:hypothetical protein
MLDLLDRNTLIGSLPHGGIGAEIGVDVGLFSEVILERNQPRELWLVDCWHHQDSETYGSDPANAIEQAQEGKYQEVLRRFSDRPNVRILREWSVAAAAMFDDEFFDWVYIDANHLQVDRDLPAWWQRPPSHRSPRRTAPRHRSMPAAARAVRGSAWRRCLPVRGCRSGGRCADRSGRRSAGDPGAGRCTHTRTRE